MKNTMLNATFLAILFLLLVTVSNSIPAQAYNYDLSWEHANSHLYNVSLKTAPQAGQFSDFQVPAWRPGRYYIQDYAAGISGFQAFDANGKPLSWKKTDINTWQVENPVTGEIEVRYKFYANTMDAGSCVLDASQAYFNPVNFFMHQRDRYEIPCTLTVSTMPAGWRSATALKKIPGTHNVFIAEDYHEFADSPTILSPSIKTLHSRIEGVDYYFHFQGDFTGGKETEDAYQSNMAKIIREQSAIFGEMPLAGYHFIYQLLPYNMGHAVEHKFSSCYAMPNTVAQSAQAIARLNSISAHEFFHLWNVKRIRPAAMWPYDYQKEAYTRLHWFTEGVTDYYTSLSLTRAGLYSRETFFSILGRTIQSLESNYASQIISPAASSFDSWLDRSDYHPPFARISYYTLGTRVGLLLDLSIRSRSGGKLSLDDVFRKLYSDFYKQDRGLDENAVQNATEAVTGQSYQQFFDRHVFGTGQINYAEFFSTVGLELEETEPNNLSWEKIGLEKVHKTNGGIVIDQVRPGTDAANAGLGDKDLIREINGAKVDEFDAADFFGKFKKPKTLEIGVLRDGVALTVPVTWTNSWLPKNYAVVPMKKPRPEQLIHLEDWLGSKQ